MRLFLRLLSVQLRQRYGLSAMRAAFRESRTRSLGKLLIYLLVFLGVGSLVGAYAWLLTALMPAFMATGMPDILPGIALLVAMLVVFLLGLFYLMGILYFARDTAFLASLPIPEQTVFASKFAQVMLSEMASCALILLPAFIVYGMHTGAGFTYWLRAVWVLLMAPGIPLALSALVSLLLMRASVLWRRRDLLTILGSVLFVAAMMLGQGYLSSRMPQDMSQQAIAALVASQASVLRGIASAFPPSGWAAQGLAHGGGALALFSAVSVAALGLLLLLSGRLYYRGAMAQMEAHQEVRRVRLTARAFRRRGPVRALFLREWRLVLRTPMYALNGLMVIILGPILVLLPLLFSGASMGAVLQPLVRLVEGALGRPLLVCLLAAVFAVLSNISPALTTGLSRQGRQYYLSRTIPVSPGRQVLALFAFGLSVAMLTMASTGVIAIVALRIPAAAVAWGILLGMLASIAPLALSMLPDMLRPKLHWNSETEAIKQNVNAILGMLVGWAYLALVIFSVYKTFGPNLTGGHMVLIALALSALNAASLYLLCRAARKGLRATEG